MSASIGYSIASAAWLIVANTATWQPVRTAASLVAVMLAIGGLAHAA